MLLQPGAASSRLPPRIAEFRQPNYLSVFDKPTVFYDVFAAEGGDKIIAIGPPPLNLQDNFDRTRISVSGKHCDVEQINLIDARDGKSPVT
jgi:hypothetical protein